MISRKVNIPAISLRKAYRVLIICCSYYFPPCNLAFRFLNFFRRNKACCIDIVIVSNSSYREDLSPSSSLDNLTIHYLLGSNKMLDISAYAEGLMHAKSLDIYHNYTIFINDSTVCRHNFELSLACLISYDYISSFDSEHPILIGRYRSYDQILWKNPINKFSFFFPTDAFGLNSLAAELMMEIYLSLQGFESELTAQINKVSACPQFNSLYQFLFLSDASKWSPANGLIKILPEDIVDLKRKTMLFEHSLSGIVGRDGLLIQYNGGAMQKFSFFILRTLYSFTRRLPIWFQFIVNDTIFLFRAPQKN